VEDQQARPNSGPKPGEAPTTWTTTIRVRVPDDGSEVRYANGLSVQFTGAEYILAFFQVVPPPVSRPEDLPEEVPGRMLVKIAMPTEKWHEALRSFAEQIKALPPESAKAPVGDNHG
jgi:hypothetical protein